MNRIILAAGLAFSLLLVGPLQAQEATTEGTEFAVGEDATLAPGQVYSVETHGDWEVRCVKANEGQKDPCHIYQLLRNEEGFSVAEMTMFPLPLGTPGQAVAGATIVTPLGTLLTAKLVIAIDGSAPRQYPYNWCTAVGCFARVGLTAEEVIAMKSGASGSMTLVSISAPEKPLTLNLSLNGFTAAYAALAL